ncbi:porin family protein [Bradyrhizobium genosp. L]|uniref:outer membrane protein n=1 Tax=Bradyrhizobium genosp. L TaxID=83637 RepID=UPI0018A2FAB5|nr:outer membrane protein [Bradyrhizobium genosp. L]QPF83862.1 porin family protein [Bradyrhizobium genosp. L]
MKKLFFATTALAVFGFANADAADLAARPYTKAPPPVIDPGTNWSGFYIGGFGGYGWSDRVRASVAGFGSASISTSDLNGGFGGATIGYNWQSGGSPFVFGIEVDAAGSDIKYSTTVLGVTGTDKIDAFGSVTGRLGYAAGATLLYAKGGYAWADNKLSATAFGITASESHIHSGWTVGGGVEWMFAPNWSAKAEYMYADFGKENYGAGVIPPGVDIGASIHTIKGGINYHFGGPVVARY